MAKQKTTINIETHNILVVRPIHSPINFWCSECGMTVSMVTPERAAIMIQTSPREIYRKVETGEIHFVEISDKELFVCCRCLQNDGMLTK